MTEIERLIQGTDLERRTEQLRPNRLLLTFGSYQKPLVHEFQIKHERKYRRTFYAGIIVYAFLFLLQTLIILTVRRRVEDDLGIGIHAWNIVVRGIFTGVIFFNCIFKRFASRRLIA